MKEEEAARVLKELFERDKGVFCLGRYISMGDDLSGSELDAVRWWIQNKGRG